MHVLKDYAGIWCRGDVCENTAWLWGAAIIAPLDQGWRKKDDGNGEQEKKIRPIALAECLLKFAETVIINQVRDTVAEAMVPSQVGCGVPDGATLTVQLLKGATRAMANEAGA